MKFRYLDYNKTYENIINTFLDNEAVSQTGIDNGFDDFYDYWARKLKKDYYYKLIYFENELIGVIFLDYVPSIKSFHISEFIVSPKYRGKGFGTKIINDLLINSKDIMGVKILKVNAVIFKNNIASIKMFTKCGFTLDKIHEDGTVLYYSKIIKC